MLRFRMSRSVAPLHVSTREQIRVVHAWRLRGELWLQNIEVMKEHNIPRLGSYLFTKCLRTLIHQHIYLF